MVEDSKDLPICIFYLVVVSLFKYFNSTITTVMMKVIIVKGDDYDYEADVVDQRPYQR